MIVLIGWLEGRGTGGLKKKKEEVFEKDGIGATREEELLKLT